MAGKYMFASTFFSFFIFGFLLAQNYTFCSKYGFPYVKGTACESCKRWSDVEMISFYYIFRIVNPSRGNFLS